MIERIDKRTHPSGVLSEVTKRGLSCSTSQITEHRGHSHSPLPSSSSVCSCLVCSRISVRLNCCCSSGDFGHCHILHQHPNSHLYALRMWLPGLVWKQTGWEAIEFSPSPPNGKQMEMHPVANQFWAGSTIVHTFHVGDRLHLWSTRKSFLKRQHMQNPLLRLANTAIMC